MKTTFGIAMTLLALFLFIALLISNITKDRSNENSSDEFGKLCLDGVVYWRGYNMLAPKYNTDGSVALCRQ